MLKIFRFYVTLVIYHGEAIYYFNDLKFIASYIWQYKKINLNGLSYTQKLITTLVGTYQYGFKM